MSRTSSQHWRCTSIRRSGFRASYSARLASRNDGQQNRRYDSGRSVLAGFYVGLGNFGVTVAMVVLAAIGRAHIVRRDANAAVVAPNGFWIVGNGRLRFQ